MPAHLEYWAVLEQRVRGDDDVVLGQFRCRRLALLGGVQEENLHRVWKCFRALDLPVRQQGHGAEHKSAWAIGRPRPREDETEGHDAFPHAHCGGETRLDRSTEVPDVSQVQVQMGRQWPQRASLSYIRKPPRAGGHRWKMPRPYQIGSPLLVWTAVRLRSEGSSAGC